MKNDRPSYNLSKSLSVLIGVILLCSCTVAKNNTSELLSTDVLDEEGYVINKGLYRNPEYLFSFRVPTGLICLSDPPPSPNHGCRIFLSNNPNSYIYIGGDYNSSESLSPGDHLMRIYMDSLIKDGTEIAVLKRIPLSLDNLPGERLTIRYRHENDEISMVKDVVVVFRTVEGYGEIIYTISLDTPRFRSDADKKIFEKILSSWISESPPSASEK